MFIPDSQKYKEEELVLLLAVQNLPAFSSLYNNYAPALYGIIFRILGEKELAEDILQEVFIKILANIDRYDRSKGRLFTWLAAISRNLAIDTVRSKSYQLRGRTVFEDYPEDIADHTGNDHPYDGIGLKNKLLLLSTNHQAVLELSYFGGCTHAQIADELTIPIGTVKTRIRAAISALRKLLDVPLRA